MRKKIFDSENSERLKTVSEKEPSRFSSPSCLEDIRQNGMFFCLGLGPFLPQLHCYGKSTLMSQIASSCPQ